MTLGHEKLDVYGLSIDYVSWVYEGSERLNGVHRHARDQWLRASQSIPLNIAEGNGKTSEPDRRRYFEIARGYSGEDERAIYRTNEIDPHSDSDFDPMKQNPNQTV